MQDWVRNCRGFPTTALTPQRLEEAAQYLLRRRPDLIMGLPSAQRAELEKRFGA